MADGPRECARGYGRDDRKADFAPSTDLEQAEAEYEAFVEKNLPRNFAGHFLHGMLGMTGFRIFNAPTFLPAYVHLITRAMPGSDLLVAASQSLQQLGSVVSPVIGAAQVEHRKRVLPSRADGHPDAGAGCGDRYLRLGAGADLVWRSWASCCC